MANIERGEVEVIVNSKPYTLKLSMNAAAVLQTKHKKTIGMLFKEASDLDFFAIRAMVWLFLQKFHAEEFKTEEQAGNFIDDAGGVNLFFNAIQALGEANAEGADPNQPAQTNGTGVSSISALDASA